MNLDDFADAEWRRPLPEVFIIKDKSHRDELMNALAQGLDVQSSAPDQKVHDVVAAIKERNLQSGSGLELPISDLAEIFTSTNPNMVMVKNGLLHAFYQEISNQINGFVYMLNAAQSDQKVTEFLVDDLMDKQKILLIQTLAMAKIKPFLDQSVTISEERLKEETKKARAELEVYLDETYKGQLGDVARSLWLDDNVERQISSTFSDDTLHIRFYGLLKRTGQQLPGQMHAVADFLVNHQDAVHAVLDEGVDFKDVMRVVEGVQTAGREGFPEEDR